MTSTLIAEYKLSVLQSQKRRLRLFMLTMMILFILFFFAFFSIYGFSDRFILDLFIRSLIIGHSAYLYHRLGDDSFRDMDRNLIIYLLHLSSTVLYVNYEQLPYPTLSILLDIAVAYTVIFVFPVDIRFKVSLATVHLVIDLLINDLLIDMDVFVKYFTLGIALFIMLLGYYISDENQSFNRHNLELIKEQVALKKNIKQLEELLPICMHCHRIRDDEDNWEEINKYVAKLPDVKLTHGVCEDCMQEHYHNL